MTIYYNKITLIGKVKSIPATRSMTTSEKQVTSFVLKTAVTYLDKKDPERKAYKTEAEYHRIVVYAPELLALAVTLNKNDIVFVEGYLKYRKFTDKNEIERIAAEVVLSGFKSELKLMQKAPDVLETEDGEINYNSYNV